MPKSSSGQASERKKFRCDKHLAELLEADSRFQNLFYINYLITALKVTYEESLRDFEAIIAA